MSTGPGRFGDSARKSREAFIQHNGWLRGNLKFLVRRRPEWVVAGAGLAGFAVLWWMGVI